MPDLLRSCALDVPMCVMRLVMLTGVVITSAELVAARDVYSDRGLLAWRVLRYQFKWAMRGSGARIANWLMSEQHFAFLLVTRCGAAILLLVATVAGYAPVALWIALVALTVAVNVRSHYGLDGAFQMNFIVMTAVMAIGIAPSMLMTRIALLFVSLELFLSYFIAGLAKLRSPTWRNGQALRGIVSTHAYGLPMLGRGDLPLAAYAVVSWLVIGFECAAPLMLSGRREIVIPYLAFGALFHLGTAVIMGLNGFLFAFIAAYPAAWWTFSACGSRPH